MIYSLRAFRIYNEGVERARHIYHLPDGLCQNGLHDMSEDNTGRRGSTGTNYCKACRAAQRERANERARRKRAARRADRGSSQVTG